MYILSDTQVHNRLQGLVPTNEVLDGGWTRVFTDPANDAEWIVFHRDSHLQGGGHRFMRPHPAPQLISDWMVQCFSSGEEDDIIGLAWEFSKDYTRWPDILDWLEENASNYPWLQVRKFLNNLDIFYVKNRRPIIGKSAEEIEEDYHYFLSLAQRAGKIMKTPNTACSGRWGFCAFSSIFLCLSFFPFGRRSTIRPSATNASRWAVPCKTKVVNEYC